MEVLVTKTDFIAENVIDTFESLLWTERYCGEGDFEIYAPVDLSLFSSLQPDYYLSIRNSEKVMIVEDRQIKTDDEEGDRLIITGRSLESILRRRIVWGQTILTGSFQSGIQKLLTENIIAPTNVNRKIDNFIFEASTDPVITALTVDSQYNGDNLYDVIQALCASKNLGFKITLSNDNKFIFKLYSGVNRSYSQETNPYVVFSPKFENLLNSNYLETTRAMKTVALVRGVSDKTATAEAIAGGGVGVARREMFTDATDISNLVAGVAMADAVYTAQLTQRGKEQLSENIFAKSFEGEVETIRLFKYGEDFFLGDILQLANKYGMETYSRAVEIVRSENLSGFSVIPTFATV